MVNGVFLDVCLSPFRLKQTQTKSKKDNKLDLFGFEDADTHQEENSSNSADGRSTYKIKYFGFDDMSESDSDGADDDGNDGSKEARKGKKTVVAKETPMVTVEDMMSYDVPDPFESLETREETSAKENKKISEKQDRIRAGWTHFLSVHDEFL